MAQRALGDPGCHPDASGDVHHDGSTIGGAASPALSLASPAVAAHSPTPADSATGSADVGACLRSDAVLVARAATITASVPGGLPPLR